MQKVEFYAVVHGSTSFVTLRPSAIQSVEMKNETVIVETVAARYEIEPGPHVLPSDYAAAMQYRYDELVAAMLNSDRPAPGPDDEDDEDDDHFPADKQSRDDLLLDCRAMAGAMRNAIRIMHRVEHSEDREILRQRDCIDYMAWWGRRYPADDTATPVEQSLEIVSVERRPEEASLLQDCALAARLMTEAINWILSADLLTESDNDAGATVLLDYMREFVRSYEHVIDLRRPDPDV